MFKQGPLGIDWLWKATLIPLARVFVPIPQMMAVHKRFWLAKQAMLCAMNFMLAAEAAGLQTVPMEGFDTERLRRSLDLPRSWEPILVVPIGYAASGPAKTRLPLERVMLVIEKLRIRCDLLTIRKVFRECCARRGLRVRSLLSSAI